MCENVHYSLVGLNLLLGAGISMFTCTPWEDHASLLQPCPWQVRGAHCAPCAPGSGSVSSGLKSVNWREPPSQLVPSLLREFSPHWVLVYMYVCVYVYIYHSLYRYIFNIIYVYLIFAEHICKKCSFINSIGYEHFSGLYVVFLFYLQ